jgi:hypothetical protein
MVLVVLVPLLVMVVACLLERFEARTVPGDPTRRATRVSRTGTAAPTAPVAPTAVAADASSERHLRVVPGDETVDVEVPAPRTDGDDRIDPQPVPQAS